MIVDSSELSSRGGSRAFGGVGAVDEVSVVDCMNRKLKMLYHLSQVVSRVKSARLT